jgi:hypothetical protein
MKLVQNGLMAAVAALVLSACGGGGSAATGTDASDKYVGRWVKCNVFLTTVAGKNSYTDELTVTKVGASTYSVAGARNEFVANNCTGTGAAIVGESGTTVYTIVGTKTANLVVADKVTYPTGASTVVKDIAYVNAAGTELRLGYPAGGYDTEGYPNALDPAVYNKQ